MSEIIYKSKNAVVICKSPGISSQPDRAGGRDAMTSLSAVLAESGENSTLYPVHRLDNVVGGLIIYARTGKAAAELSALVSTDGVGKEYYAVVDGTPEAGIYTDYLRKDSRQSKAVIASKSDRDAREAVLTLTPIHTVSVGTAEKTLVKILLHTGRFHHCVVPHLALNISLYPFFLQWLHLLYAGLGTVIFSLVRPFLPFFNKEYECALTGP